MTESLPATTTLADATKLSWDVIIVGAGPAGAMAGLLLAHRGRRVLIVERAQLPRDKPCGCCLSALGCTILHQHGLGYLLNNTVALTSVEVRRANQRITIDLPTGRAIPRRVLDTELVRAATDAGAQYLPEHNARLVPVDDEGTRKLIVTRGTEAAELRAALILACDGIRGSLLDSEPGCSWRIAHDAWMGTALTLAESPEQASLFSPGVIHMHVGADAYVGVVRLSDDCVHFAAALDPAAAKAAGGPLPLMQSILETTGIKVDLTHGAARGTPLLTRHRAVFGGQRVLALGDACGYIEPFTGEGMTWALSSAALLSEVLPEDLTTWETSFAHRWTIINRHHLRHHHQLCGALRYVLHRPRLHRAGLTAMSLVPRAGRHVVRMINRPAPAGAAI